MTITSSPSRTSLRRRSSSLWSVASFTVTPDTCTGSSTANGTMCPVRPTFQATCFSVVVAVVGGNFQAIAPRGSRPTTPSWRCRSRSSTFTTTPSISKSSRSRRSSHASAGRHDLLDGVVHLARRGFTRKPCSRSHSSHSWCVVELEPLDRPDPVRPHRQRPRGRQRRVELADRAGGRVARVREGRLAGLGALLVQARERRQRQVDLAAHLEQRRRVLHAQRDRADRAQVLGHVLADLAVAARGAAHEHAVLVHERDREPVDLRLGHEADVAHLHALAREVALAAHAPRPPAPPRCARSPATASAGGAAPPRTCRAAGRPRAAWASRACAAPGAPPRCRAARSAARRSRGPRSPGRRGRSSGGRGTRAGAAAPRPRSLRRWRYSTASRGRVAAGARGRSPRAPRRPPGRSGRSGAGVTAIRPSAIAAKSVPVLVLVARLLAVDAVAPPAALVLLGRAPSCRCRCACRAGTRARPATSPAGQFTFRSVPCGHRHLVELLAPSARPTNARPSGSKSRLARPTAARPRSPGGRARCPRAPRRPCPSR